MTGWLIALGILVLLAILPLGVSALYNADGPLIRLILGPVKLTLFPRKKKPKKENPKKEAKAKAKAEAKKAAKAQKKAQAAEQKAKQKKPSKSGGKLTDFLPLVKTGLAFLGDFRRKLRVNRLEVKLIMAGSDPCDLAVNYGKSWAAVANLMPHLERIFVIKKRDVEVECDFTADKTLIFARLDVTITLGRLIALVVRYGIRALRDFIKIKNKRKGGAKS